MVSYSKVECNGVVYYIINVYSSCSIKLKWKLWKESLDLKQKYQDSEWLIRGDFNAAKKRSEKVGAAAATI